MSSPPSTTENSCTPAQNRVLDAHARILENRARGITFQHTVLCQAALPYRNPGDDTRSWNRTQGSVSLRVNAGEALDPDTQKWVDIGLPFGPKARLILMDLNQQALRCQSPEIDVGDSMTAYLAKRIGLDTNGRQVRALKEQVSRLSTSLIRLAVAHEGRGYQIDTKIVTSFDLWFPKQESQRVLWPSVVRLSDDYFNSLVKHAVPLKEEAIAALSHSAMALDLYAWLAQRLHRIGKRNGQFVPWTALQQQFGPDYRRTRDFRRFFRKQLRQVSLVYPEAKLDADRSGIRLYNSSPPVKARLISTRPKPE